MASTSGLATPAYRITMEEYIRRSRKRRISETDGLGMHTVILDLMRHRQELWKRRSVAEVEDWQKLGVEVYERTGKIVSVNTMKSVFEDTKKTLRDMLIDIIQGLKADRILLRALLNNWPLYRHFDYYHAEILDFELHLYEELEEEEEELDEEEEEEEEEDDEERKDLVEQIVKTRYETANMRPCFTCTECSNAFDFEQDPPLVLPCGHPFYCLLFQMDPTTGQKLKRPPNVYILFVKSKRAEVAKNVEGGLSVSRELGAIWKSMTPEEKAPYAAEAEAIRLEFRKNHPNYRATRKRKAEQPEPIADNWLLQNQENQAPDEEKRRKYEEIFAPAGFQTGMANIQTPIQSTENAGGSSEEEEKMLIAPAPSPVTLHELVPPAPAPPAPAAAPANQMYLNYYGAQPNTNPYYHQYQYANFNYNYYM